MPPTALIVEDEPEANRLLAMLVQLRGYRTESAFTGAEALDKVGRRPPDIVFLDLMLPDVNGYEVCRSIKSDKETALIPVVMVTARVAVENRIQSYCHAADQYVPKPYTPDEIYSAMDQADAWRKGVDGQPAEGEIPLSTRDEGESLRRLGQLRSLLLARTPLGVDDACRLNEAFREIAREADAWGRGRPGSEVARLAYRAEPDRVVFSVRDRSGWFSDDPRSPADRWPAAVALGRFDAVGEADGGSEVVFVKRFPDPERPAGSHPVA